MTRLLVNNINNEPQVKVSVLRQLVPVVIVLPVKAVSAILEGRK